MQDEEWPTSPGEASLESSLSVLPCGHRVAEEHKEQAFQTTVCCSQETPVSKTTYQIKLTPENES